MRFALVAFLVACASGAPSDMTPDAVGPDAEQPPQPPSAASCEEDQHACGATCVGQQPNEPSVGCSFGCGAACPTPANANATCSAAGTCDFRCPSGLARVGNACVASACEQKAYACGSFVDDSGTAFDCGGCVGASACGANHQCVIAPDSREDNDSLAQAKSLGDFNDADDPLMWIDNLSIDATADEDWFRFHITDGLDYGNPDATIELANRATQLGWLDSAHELTVWFKCDTANAASRVRCGEWFATSAENTLNDPALGIGCTVDAQYVVWATIAPSCSGIADSGMVTFRVRKRTPPRGDLYDLRVAVE